MLKQALPIIALISILTFVNWLNNSSEHQTVGQECKMIQGNCTLIYSDLAFTVSISPTPIQVEEPLSVDYSYPKGIKLTSTWVEGHNMFMGKMKIIPEKRINDLEQVTHSGLLFLGSCSQPNMVWKLMSVFEDIQSGETFTLTYYFETSLD